MTDGGVLLEAGRVRIVRNHVRTQPNPVGEFGNVSHAYDPAAPGGTTTLEISPTADEVSSWVSLNGTTFSLPVAPARGGPG